MTMGLIPAWWCATQPGSQGAVIIRAMRAWLPAIVSPQGIEPVESTITAAASITRIHATRPRVCSPSATETLSAHETSNGYQKPTHHSYNIQLAATAIQLATISNPVVKQGTVTSSPARAETIHAPPTTPASATRPAPMLATDSAPIPNPNVPPCRASSPRCLRVSPKACSQLLL
ncbi:hypothetical protein BCR44DRAFT_92891 [Catenaria anguillulae PL171]|uniref:Uncharacterized protein n=1 Tax=Catenaria anguillulae PL171 TaxID=765915 RepID=A0A1Y2H9F8_9FUNG|nr:hypothetical protein BCR44DRAFT_92891 [Catenaria anguillulae PL171]